MHTDHDVSRTLILFFDELIAMSLSKAVNKLDDLIIMVDFNIDITKEVCLVNDKLKKIYDTFNLIMILQQA